MIITKEIIWYVGGWKAWWEKIAEQVKGNQEFCAILNAVFRVDSLGGSEVWANTWRKWVSESNYCQLPVRMYFQTVLRSLAIKHGQKSFALENEQNWFQVFILLHISAVMWLKPFKFYDSILSSVKWILQYKYNISTEKNKSFTFNKPLILE